MCSSTPTKRSDHHVWPIAPRVLRALSPPSTARGRAGGGYQLLLTDSALRQGEDLAQVLGGQLGEPGLSVADHQVSQRLLVLDHLVDLLFQRPRADELAYLDVAFLADAEGPVGRLVLDRGVPPPVEMDHVARRGQIQ